MEVVTFIDDTYWSLSDDTIIMPFSDKKEMVSIKRKSTNYSKESVSGESSGKASL